MKNMMSLVRNCNLLRALSVCILCAVFCTLTGCKDKNNEPVDPTVPGTTVVHDGRRQSVFRIPIRHARCFYRQRLLRDRYIRCGLKTLLALHLACFGARRQRPIAFLFSGPEAHLRRYILLPLPKRHPTRYRCESSHALLDRSKIASCLEILPLPIKEKVPNI